ncbi:hypothetical protein DYGSA30_05790 [Dyella sp. GSA-30]|nr:hypothetical protein DYGSA30_05790 [Dyella sp. GSA-30]
MGLGSRASRLKGTSNNLSFVVIPAKAGMTNRKGFWRLPEVAAVAPYLTATPMMNLDQMIAPIIDQYDLVPVLNHAIYRDLL